MTQGISMAKPDRRLLVIATAVTLPALVWYAIASTMGDLVQANYAMLALLGSTVLWTSVLYQHLVARPIEAWLQSRSAG